MGRRSSDEDDDEDDASCEWFSGFPVGERDRHWTRRSRTDRGDRVFICMCAGTVEYRLGIPRICTQPAQLRACADVIHVAGFRDKNFPVARCRNGSSQKLSQVQLLRQHALRHGTRHALRHGKPRSQAGRWLVMCPPCTSCTGFAIK